MNDNLKRSCLRENNTLDWWESLERWIKNTFIKRNVTWLDVLRISCLGGPCKSWSFSWNMQGSEWVARFRTRWTVHIKNFAQSRCRCVQSSSGSFNCPLIIWNNWDLPGGHAEEAQNVDIMAEGCDSWVQFLSYISWRRCQRNQADGGFF